MILTNGTVRLFFILRAILSGFNIFRTIFLRRCVFIHKTLLSIHENAICYCSNPYLFRWNSRKAIFKESKKKFGNSEGFSNHGPLFVEQRAVLLGTMVLLRYFKIRRGPGWRLSAMEEALEKRVAYFSEVLAWVFGYRGQSISNSTTRFLDFAIESVERNVLLLNTLSFISVPKQKDLAALALYVLAIVMFLNNNIGAWGQRLISWVAKKTKILIYNVASYLEEVQTSFKKVAIYHYYAVILLIAIGSSLTKFLNERTGRMLNFMTKRFCNWLRKVSSNKSMAEFIIRILVADESYMLRFMIFAIFAQAIITICIFIWVFIVSDVFEMLFDLIEQIIIIIITRFF